MPNRGRKRNNNLPPNRNREIQRAFRARRAAHLQALEQRVSELDEENKYLRQKLNLRKASRPPLGKGPTGVKKPNIDDDQSLDDGSSSSSDSKPARSLSPPTLATFTPPPAAPDAHDGTQEQSHLRQHPNLSISSSYPLSQINPQTPRTYYLSPISIPSSRNVSPSTSYISPEANYADSRLSSHSEAECHLCAEECPLRHPGSSASWSYPPPSINSQIPESYYSPPSAIPRSRYTSPDTPYISSHTYSPSESQVLSSDESGRPLYSEERLPRHPSSPASLSYSLSSINPQIPESSHSHLSPVPSSRSGSPGTSYISSDIHYLHSGRPLSPVYSWNPLSSRQD